jgi:hypothetical protein
MDPTPTSTARLPRDKLFSKAREGLFRDPSQSPSRSHSRSSSLRRASFGSVKEDVDGIAQSFLDTKLEDLQLPPEKKNTAVDMAVVDQMPDFCCPCGGFMGWKQIRLRGRKMSKSYSDLRLLGHRSSSTAWAWDTPGKRPAVAVLVEPEILPRLTIEDLPVEVLGELLVYCLLVYSY